MWRREKTKVKNANGVKILIIMTTKNVIVKSSFCLCNVFEGLLFIYPFDKAIYKTRPLISKSAINKKYKK